MAHEICAAGVASYGNISTSAMLPGAMKSRATKAFGLFILCCASAVYCSDKGEYQSGILVDLQMVEGASGYSRAGETYCLAVTVGDLGYLLRYGPIWAFGYSPSDFI